MTKLYFKKTLSFGKLNSIIENIPQVKSKVWGKNLKYFKLNKKEIISKFVEGSQRAAQSRMCSIIKCFLRREERSPNSHVNLPLEKLKKEQMKTKLINI